MSSQAHTGPGLRHDAFFFHDDDAMIASTVPFVREGVERGETVLVSTGPGQLTGLLKALFADEAQVVFNDLGYGKPVAAIDGYKRAIDHGLAKGVPGFRLVGTIDFESNPLPWTEWVRYEAAVNQVFRHYPVTTLCLHDTRTVAPEIVHWLRRVHTGVVDGRKPVRNPEYVEPAELLTEPALLPQRDPCQDDPVHMEIDPGPEVRELRINLYPAIIFTALSRRKVDDFVKAVCEVVANAYAHGEGPVWLRLWTDARKLLCTVTDQGPGIDDPLRGYARSIGSATTRSKSTEDGLGLWAARQLCDILDYERTEDGFTVRLLAFDGTK